MAMANTCDAATPMDAACIFSHSFHPFIHHLLEAAKEIVHYTFDCALIGEPLGEDRVVAVPHRMAS
jgi:hypothetical protein